jgi:putative hemolysin
VDPILGQVVFVVGLLALSAFFSGSEAALFSLPTAVVQRFQEGRSGAHRAVTRLVREPQALLITILLCNLLVNLLATSRATELLVAALGQKTGSWVAWIGMTTVVLVAGEITPKVLAVQHCEPVSLLAGRVLHPLCFLLAPVRLILMRLVAPITSGWHAEQQRMPLERAELHTAVEEAAEAGSIHPSESDLLLALLDLEEARVKEVMTPRVLIRGIAADTPVADLPLIARRLRRARLPVFAGSVDTIIGMLRVHDLVGSHAADRSFTARHFARDALFVPENLTLDRLLRRFRAEGEDIAVVLDEFGSVAGLVTIQDVVDEVFGPVPDRHDPASPAMVLGGDGDWILPGNFPVDGIERALGIRVEDPLVETIGGRITHVLGRIPAAGELVQLPEGLRARIVRADQRRIIELCVRCTESPVSG